MAKVITINISPAGSSKIEAAGFTGRACEDATQQLELVLGGGASAKRDKKPEYSLPASTTHHDTVKY